MKKNSFEEKTIYVHNETIELNMCILNDFCKSLNVLIDEFKSLVGYSPDLQTILHLIRNENKVMSKDLQNRNFLKGSEPGYIQQSLGLSRFKTPEELLDYIKECYVRHQTDTSSINVSGMKMNFKKMLDLVDYPSFDNLISLIRNAVIMSEIVSRNQLKKFIHNDLSNIYKNGYFYSELLKNDIVEFNTIKTKTNADNELIEIVTEVCEKLNELQKRGFNLTASNSRGDGKFRGIDCFIEHENQKYIVSKHFLNRC